MMSYSRGRFRNIAGWSRLQILKRDDGKKDFVGLYKLNAKPICAIVFQGSEDNVDWMHNIAATPKTWCGKTKVHAGFASYLDRFKRVGGSMVKKMRSKSTCGQGIVSVGHSLGGALAGLLAACANRKSQGSAWRTFLKGIEVKELYTFGAPEVVQGGIRNDRRKSGCFNGARFYNEQSQFKFDPVPLIARTGTRIEKYKHPAVNAVRLQDDSHTIHSCTKKPKSVRSYPKWSQMRFMQQWSQHHDGLYVQRINKAVRG